MNTDLDIRPYKVLPDLHLWAHWGQSDALNVCFSGIGVSEDGVAPYEFARTATMDGRDNALFISDSSRSWLSTPGLLELIVTEVTGFAAAIGAQRLRTLGHSMGGFMAMMLPAFTPVDCAVGFSPQVSVHPDVVGDDPRWMALRSKIREVRFRSIMDHLVPDTRYYAFHGRHKREAPQRERFQARENLTHIVIPSTVHEVPQKLRGLGIVESVVSACFDGRTRRLRSLLDPLDARFRKPGKGQPLAPSADLLRGMGQNLAS